LKNVTQNTYALAGPNGRLPGTWGHKKAQRHIKKQFRKLGLKPFSGKSYALPYKSEYDTNMVKVKGGFKMTNLVGVIPGDQPQMNLPPIVIGAHYDSVIAHPSADDNATSVAAMLDAAKQILAGPRLAHDVIIAAFDGEEPPFFHSPNMGSTRFVEDHLNGQPVHLAIIMDLIGHPSPFEMLDPHLTAITGVESHHNLVTTLHGTHLPLLVAENSWVGDMSDHHAFRLAGHPFLFLSSGEWADYHTKEDLPHKIDYTKVQAVANEITRLTRAADGLVLGGGAKYHNIEDIALATAIEQLGEEFVMAAGGTGQSVIQRMRGAMLAV
jgi:Peptidase family M28